MGSVHATSPSELKVSPSPEPYVRTLLHRDAEREVMLARWRLHGHCSPHDHGLATGLVIVLDGRFRETRWAWQRDVLERTDERLLSAGDEIRVGEGLIHSMQSLSTGTTLHLYAPAISGMQVFDPQTRHTLIVADECGAWIPEDTRLIHTRRAWGHGESRR